MYQDLIRIPAYRLLKTNTYLIAFYLAQLFLGVTGAFAGAPTTVERVLEMTPFGAGDWVTIKQGGTAAATVAGTSNREIAVGVACLLAKHEADPLSPFRKPKPMLPDHIIISSGILPATADLDAFNTVNLREFANHESQRYRQFSGGFGLNLSKNEIDRFQLARNNTDYPADQFYTELRNQLWGRFSSYRKKGLAGIQEYDRGSQGIAEPKKELKTTLLDAKPLKAFFPELYWIWFEDQPVVPDNGREHYSLINANLDGLPTLILSHRIELDLGERQIIGERLFYSSRFMNVGYVLAATIPVEEGQLFFYAYRVWIDQWRFFAELKQSAGQKLMIKQMEAHLDSIGVCGSR